MALRYPLPYGFAKSQRVLLEQEGPRRTLWVSERTVWASLSEVRRLHAYDVIEEVDDAALDRRMAQAYAGGSGDAAAVVGEVESAVDLSRLLQDLPAVEDLLEAANDAPIIRMLNALLTQAAKDGASDIH
ncbi:MAG: type secretion system protein GspE, partial [Pseudomonadota bacterium]